MPGPPEPVDVVHLFEPERDALLNLLTALAPSDWAADTVCAGWSVKDLAAHLVGDDLGIISRWRDGHSAGEIRTDSWEALVAEINRRNEAWVEAMRRVSPASLIDLLRWLATPTLAAFRNRDPDELGGGVSWAGPEPAPGWLHVAREFTERWHHQQQIREAVAAPLLDTPAFLGPVLATFARALPRAYARTVAADGTRIGIEFTGAAGSRWTLARQAKRWVLETGPGDDEAAVVRLDQDAAWRLFTRGLPASIARDRLEVDGDPAWREPLLMAVAILA